VTKHVDTAFERHFSEPPVVTVKADRTHCEACQEPLDPSVMHKCHGNQEYQPPVISSTKITEACPDCKGIVVLVQRGDPGHETYTCVCGNCRTFVTAEVPSKMTAILIWNDVAMRARASGTSGVWPKWMAGLPGDDERMNVIPSDAKPSHPDLSNYTGACPATHIEGHECPMCEGTGMVPPRKSEGAR
jgi:transcription elongation factor Elf1